MPASDKGVCYQRCRPPDYAEGQVERDGVGLSLRLKNSRTMTGGSTYRRHSRKILRSCL
jgi:hypothetical protein